MITTSRKSQLKSLRGNGILVDHYVQGDIEHKHLKAGDTSCKKSVYIPEKKMFVFFDPTVKTESEVREFWTNQRCYNLISVELRQPSEQDN